MSHELSVERVIDAPVAAVWRALVGHLDEWWCPRPWRAELDELDLRAGGRLRTIMHGPAGERAEVDGVILEVVPERLLVFSDAFRAGWLPEGPFMVGVMEFTPDGTRTRYVGRARHWSAEAMEQHRAKGFADGWGKAAEQLEEVARRLAASA